MNDFTQISKQLDKAATRIQVEAPRIGLAAANQVLASLKRRIFFRGEDSKDTKIGDYSTKPMLVGSTSFTKYGSQVPGAGAVNKLFGSKKKRSSREWVTVKGQSLMVLKGGYKEFREILGRATDKVNLFLTGDLFRSIVTGATDKGAAVGMNSDENYQKAIGNERHFGKEVFTPSEGEELEAEDIVADELEDILLNDGRTGR